MSDAGPRESGRLIFAYDGSIHGDWVSHYAIRLGAGRRDRKLVLVHVVDRPATNGQLAEKLAALTAECRAARVALAIEMRPLAGSVFDTLQTACSRDPGELLVCGTRVRADQRGYLSGTTAERLLKSHCTNVAAIRVVQPGVLGSPRRLLLPVAGKAQGLRGARAILPGFLPGLTRLDVLHIREVSARQFRSLLPESTAALRAEGLVTVTRFEQELIERFQVPAARVHGAVVISDDVPKEIVIQATQARAELLMLGASARNLRERFFYGNPLEQILRDTPCDVVVYRGVP